MGIIALPSADGKELTLRIEGRFDFSTHQAFRRAYEETVSTPERYIVDLAQTTYVDSAALGMLLLLRDHAGGDQANVRLINCGAALREIFEFAQFNVLFTLR
ncbi:anti-anti-sigma factor [Pseudomonas duriflava]|uniref:Anti-anti-sigma factor n=1 Tax=Pseudomonas duriflava TaxID=459528 RepID=A0A562QCN4_9PSED|nr:STAS domain-containing protein [Pseudomonas duriflava]TWI53920.1 anti-anti-sigma factor [Pseudomonas duriflava]